MRRTDAFFTAEKGFELLGAATGGKTTPKRGKSKFSSQLNSVRDVPVVFPEGGFWYIYTGVDRKKNDWRVDGYRWRQGGGKKLDIQSATIQTRYFHVFDKSGKPNPEFRRCAYMRSDMPNHVLVQYLGDASVAVQLLNGKPRRKSAVQKPLGDLDAPLYPQAAPRYLNVSTVEAAQKNVRAKLQLPVDAFINIHNTMQDLEFVNYLGFSKANEVENAKGQVSTVIAIAHLPALADIFKEIASNPELTSPCLSFDTSLDLGSFYLSILLFRETEFATKPDIPLVYMVHDRKCSLSYSYFWLEINRLFPFLNEKDLDHYIVMDRKEVICKSLVNILPNCQVFYRWPHIFRQVNRKLKELKITKSEDNVYIDSLWRLFSSKSIKEYNLRIDEVVKRWSKTFRDYYTESIHPDLEQIGRWAMMKKGVDSTTINRPQALDEVIRQLQEWEDVPVDRALIVLYRLSEYFLVEIKRGRYGLGNYKLIPSESAKYEQKAFLFEPAPNVSAIVENVRNGIKDHVLQKANDKEKAITAYDQAVHFVEQGLISIDCKTRTFVIRDKEVVRVVTLFPTVTCSCYGTGKCAHILAAKLTIGISCEPKKQPAEDDYRHENRQSESFRKGAGSKRPTVNDLDVSVEVSAPKQRRLESGGSVFPANNRVDKSVRPNSSANKQYLNRRKFLSTVIDSANEAPDSILDSCKASVWVQYKELSLNLEAKERISNGKKLCNEEIYFAMQLIKENSEYLYGFQDVGQTFQPVPDGERFVQILHLASDRWICIANTLMSFTNIVVCDSLNPNGKPTQEVATLIMALLRGWKLGKNNILQVKYLPIVKQKNESEDGLIAIACAEMLSRDVDPSNCIFQDLPTHLMACFQKEPTNVTEFPHFKLVEQDVVISMPEITDF